MHVGLITYQKGHLKTRQIADQLISKGFEVSLFAFPFHLRTTSENALLQRFADRPQQLLGAAWGEIYPKENINIIKMPGWKPEHALFFGHCSSSRQPDVYLHCTAKIVPHDFIRNRTILNCHPGLLPHNRGVDAFKWSIVNKWPLGVTLHIIDEQIDHGRILARKRLRVLPTDYLQDVCDRAYETEIELLADFDQYLGNTKYGWDVGDEFPVSHDRIPQRVDTQIEKVFLENRNELVRLSTDLSSYPHPADIAYRNSEN